MRSPSGCTMQQSLTQEATTMVKRAINLARRRGHAQVTPIHVATIMLANSPSSLLQKACFKTHSHPLQYNALEVCFNVALNRLPTVSPSPILGPHSPHYPSLSNALVAAFKRAQAHQRRGSVETQQQPMLCVKIEAEQLVVSILDDPSVSRVLREAGFSSSHVKANVEQAMSLISINPVVMSSSVNFDQPSPLPLMSNQGVRNEDVLGVILSMVSKCKKSCSTIVVSECLSTCESLVRSVKEKIERGDVPNELKFAQFLHLPMASIKSFSKEEVEMKLVELKNLLKGCITRGVILYLGDLKWVSEYWSNYGGQRSNYYCPVEHIIIGLRRLFYGNIFESGKFRLLGIANFSTYMNCKKGQPSLETLLDLHPLAIPVGSLDFSLKLDSTRQGENKSIISVEKYSKNLQENMEPSTAAASETSSLPSWLQKCKEEMKEESMSDQKDLCKKWNSICSSSHQTMNFSLATPSPCNSISSYAIKPELLSNPNSTPNSSSSSETTDMITATATELISFESMCFSLEKRVPWQKEIIPDIARTILNKAQQKKETSLFFSGADKDGKIKMAKEIAKLVFGSHKKYKYIGLTNFSSPTKADSTDDSKNKRVREEYDHVLLENFANSLRDDPHRVFYVEDIDQVDYFTQKGLKRAIESGMITLANGEMILLENAIVIFSCESFSSTSRACSPSTKQKLHHDSEKDDIEEASSSSAPLDLNLTADDDDDLEFSEFDILNCVDRQIFFKIQVL